MPRSSKNLVTTRFKMNQSPQNRNLDFINVYRRLDAPRCQKSQRISSCTLPQLKSEVEVPSSFIYRKYHKHLEACSCATPNAFAIQLPSRPSALKKGMKTIIQSCDKQMLLTSHPSPECTGSQHSHCQRVKLQFLKTARLGRRRGWWFLFLCSAFVEISKATNHGIGPLWSLSQPRQFKWF